MPKEVKRPIASEAKNPALELWLLECMPNLPVSRCGLGPAVSAGASSVGRDVPADAPGDSRRGVLDRVPRQMRVSGGRLNLGVTEKLPDDGGVEKAAVL